MNTNILKDNIKNKNLDEKIMHMYACKKDDTDKYYARFSEVIDGLEENFGEKEVVEVLRKGYKIGDKVIRHSMVKVAN